MIITIGEHPRGALIDFTGTDMDELRRTYRTFQAWAKRSDKKAWLVRHGVYPDGTYTFLLKIEGVDPEQVKLLVETWLGLTGWKLFNPEAN